MSTAVNVVSSPGPSWVTSLACIQSIAREAEDVYCNLSLPGQSVIPRQKLCSCLLWCSRPQTPQGLSSPGASKSLPEQFLGSSVGTSDKINMNILIQTQGPGGWDPNCNYESFLQIWGSCGSSEVCTAWGPAGPPLISI